ncbi:MAG: hypothetical protein Ct9H90mP16_00920 [Candidatus Poseidoniales archaeon]|nr:MAG: hypothetical protein Ct9H90mP16_00920 [Candidatus Poseidoniales archaeon]
MTFKLAGESRPYGTELHWLEPAKSWLHNFTLVITEAVYGILNGVLIGESALRAVLHDRVIIDTFCTGMLRNNL